MFDFLENLDDRKRYKVEEYLKVGLFCGWSWREFEETPLWVRKYISNSLDEKLSQYLPQDSQGGESGPPPISWFHIALLLSLSSLFGGKDK